MAVVVTTAIFIANILHASVPGGLWVILALLAYFTLSPVGNAYDSAAGYIAKIMLLILSGYALLGAFTGFCLLTRLDNVSTIIGNDLQPIVQAIEAFHGAIDVNIPELVFGFEIRDVHAAFLIPMVGLISVFLSYWQGVSLPVMVGQAGWIMVTHALPGYFVMRAFRVDQVVFWSIVGVVGVVTHILAHFGYSRIDFTWKHWIVWLPQINFFLVRAGLWVTFILSNPITSAIPLAATEWIYPGFVTYEIVSFAVLVYLTVASRYPGKGWSWDAIFYGTLSHWPREELPTMSKMNGKASKTFGYDE